MNTETIVYCVVALLLGMLLANMLKNVCGCKVVEGQACNTDDDCSSTKSCRKNRGSEKVPAKKCYSDLTKLGH